MPAKKLNRILSSEVLRLKEAGVLKGNEPVIIRALPPQGNKGPRYLIEGYGNKEFIRMNSNNYLGLSMRKEVIAAGEKTAKEFGAGPGSARFISGTFKPHIELECRLATFHGKGAGMIFSSAYAAMLGVLFPLISKDTIVVSDELNHNCIINGIRMARPKDKKVYHHNDMRKLEAGLKECVSLAKRVIIVTDGVFSMRGDCAPLPDIGELAERYDSDFDEGVLTIVDDSHGVGVLGERGRGTQELTSETRIDILVATMGKALGVNGGYIVADKTMIDYLKETAPTYIYSNPISPGEARASLASLTILDSAEGVKLLRYLRQQADYFRQNLLKLGHKVLPGVHAIVPLMLRDTQKTKGLVKHLKDNGILATGLSYPVVPRGDEEIRFQVCADHTKDDLDYVLETVSQYQI